MLCHPHPADRLRDRARGVLVIRVCAILAAGGIAGVVLFAATAYAVLMYGPDTHLSFLK